MGDAFHEGIEDGQQQADQRQADGQAVERQHQQEGEPHQQGEEPQCLSFTQLASRQRASRRALDVTIDMAIGVIVDDTAGGPHQKDPRDHRQQRPQRRHASRGQPQGPQGGPQQQQSADRLVHPRQLPVSPPTLPHHRLHTDTSSTGSAYRGEPGKNSSVIVQWPADNSNRE